MILAKLIWAFFAVGGICLIRWNRRISEAHVAANKAAADSFAFAPFQRWVDEPWMPTMSRVTTVFVGVCWTTLSVAVLVATR